jgi:hypothetical protein
MLSFAAGAKRYIILPPEECKSLYLYDRGHPEGGFGCGAKEITAILLPLSTPARHSIADWSEPDYKQFPMLKTAR